MRRSLPIAGLLVAGCNARPSIETTNQSTYAELSHIALNIPNTAGVTRRSVMATAPTGQRFDGNPPLPKA